MDTDRFFLASDATLRGVFDGLRPGDLTLSTPQDWTGRVEDPTLRDIVGAHTYDEAWVPAVLTGAAAKDGDPFAGVDLLGDDPIGAYDARHDLATMAVEAGVDPERTLHFTYGDYPAREGLAHMAIYRVFQAWLIAQLVGRPIRIPDEVLDGIEEHILPHVEMWRGFGVFPPEIEAPEGADRQTRILAVTGYWPGPAV